MTQKDWAKLNPVDRAEFSKQILVRCQIEMVEVMELYGDCKLSKSIRTINDLLDPVIDRLDGYLTQSIGESCLMDF